jgi:hypothetical protein
MVCSALFELNPAFILVASLQRLRSVDYVDLIQWPAMIITAAAAWLVGSQRRPKRSLGFWLFLLSNLLWIVWGWYARAYALIILQVCLAAINVRGAQKHDSAVATDSRAV